MILFSKQNTSIIFCGHLEGNFNITAKSSSSKVPELLDGTKIKFLYKKLTPKFTPKNSNCVPTKLLKKCSDRKPDFLLGSDIFIEADFFPQKSSLFSNILFGNKKSSFLNSQETFSEELRTFYQKSGNFPDIPTKKDGWFFHLMLFSLQKIPNKTMEAVLTPVPKEITSRFLFLLNVQLFFW